MWTAQTFVNIAQLTIMKLGIPRPPHSPIAELPLPLEVETSACQVQPYWGQASSRKQSRCGRHGLSNILKLQATFLYSIYHQRAGKTNLFHMRGGRFHAGNMLCTFNMGELRYISHDNIHEFMLVPSGWGGRSHIDLIMFYLYSLSLVSDQSMGQTAKWVT